MMLFPEGMNLVKPSPATPVSKSVAVYSESFAGVIKQKYIQIVFVKVYSEIGQCYFHNAVEYNKATKSHIEESGYRSNGVITLE